MKVSQAIRILKEHYEPNDDIIIDWWAHDVYDEEIKEEGWEQVVESVENKLEHLHDDIHNVIYETILEITGFDEKL